MNSAAHPRRDSDAHITTDNVSLSRLNEASARLWLVKNLHDGLDEMLAAAIELLGADMGNVQILDARKGVLTIATQRGFQQEFLDFFREVSATDDSACGRAMRAGERIVIEDVEADVAYAPLRPIARAAGYRAVQSTPLVSSDGAPLGMLSTHWRSPHRPSDRDLRLLDLYVCHAAAFVQRCRIDEALRQSEARKTAMFQTALDCIISMDHEGRIVEFNPAAERTFGCRREDVLGREMAELIVPPSLRERHRQGLAHYLATGEGRVLDRRVEMPALRADGTEFPVELTVTRIPVDGPPLFTAYLRDISERKQAEKVLRDREERYELVVAGAEAAIWDWDVLAKRVVFSPRWKELRGLSDTEVSDREEEWSSRIHPDDVDRVMGAVRARSTARLCGGRGIPPRRPACGLQNAPWRVRRPTSPRASERKRPCANPKSGFAFWLTARRC